nr:exodeoxyribonuclease V subunit alpha [Endozoicomonas sp. G2_1]
MSPSDKKSVADFFHIILLLSQSLRAGHTCLPLVTFAGRLTFTSVNEDGIIDRVGYVLPNIEQLAVLFERLSLNASERQPVVYANKSLYLKRYYDFEQELGNLLAERLTGDNTQIDEQTLAIAKTVIADLFPEVTAAKVDWQKLAVANALMKRFSIIAGGPGTGKTYTVSKLLAAIVQLNRKLNQRFNRDRDCNIALVAPTGKAAQRLTESIVHALSQFTELIPKSILEAIPTEAQTIHRLLGVIPNQLEFRHHQDNPLNLDVLLIDEVSMVDLPLMTRLFRALPSHCQVILLGDADQLPSVAVGNVLSALAPRPLIGYSKDNIERLKQLLPEFSTKATGLKKVNNKRYDHLSLLVESRRFAGDGGIGKIAKAVIASDVNTSWQLLSQAPENDELSLLPQTIEIWLPELVKQYYQPIFTAETAAEAFTALSKFRILAATRQGTYGVDALNHAVEQILEAQHAINTMVSGKTGGKPLYHGQPIMITENNYQLGLYNGDIGLLWRNQDNELMALFEQQSESGQMAYKQLVPSRLPAFETVYAMTIHKTQGSEFDHVAMVLPDYADNPLLSRELLYTGITRAKQKLSICSLANVWSRAVETNSERYGHLANAVFD